MSDDDSLSRSLQRLVGSNTLQWIFVGGKGGVGKTTTSCSLATMLATQPYVDPKTGENRLRRVLIISTDPAHNLSDAFSQKFSKAPSQVKGIANLYGMEVDPSSVTQQDYFDEFGKDGASNAEEIQGIKSVANILKQAASSLPGIDEVTVFGEIMREIKNMSFDTVVFDTAPTGHTLRLLALPQTLNESVDRIMDVQGLSNLVASAGQLMTNSTGLTSDQLLEKVNKWRAMIKEVQAQFTDNTKTTFVCVCIPEFLSVYETERLVQELMKYNISCENIVVNQLVEKPSNEPPCRMCHARQRIQGKYLLQIQELYEDFNVVRMPLHGDEVRGVDSLRKFSRFLLEPYDADTHGYL
jgi:arsenite-transporting ATPase